MVQDATHGGAILVIHAKALHGRWIVQRKVWALPEASVERRTR